MHVGINVKRVSKRSPSYHLNQWWVKSNQDPDLLNGMVSSLSSLVAPALVSFFGEGKSDNESNTYIFPLKDKHSQLHILQPDCCTEWRVPWLNGGDYTSASWVLITRLTHFFSWQWCLNIALHWRHNEHDGVSNHQSHDCLPNRLFRRRSKKTSKLRVTGFCRGIHQWPVTSPHKGPVTGKCVHLMTSPWNHVISLSTSIFSDTILTHKETRRNADDILRQIFKQQIFIILF